jgi:hypothetical protein
VKNLKYGMVTLQRRGVVFMTVLLRDTCSYLVGLRPATLLSLHFHFLFHLSIFYVLVAVIRRAVVTLTSLIAEIPCPLPYNIIRMSCMLEYLDIVSLCLEVVGCRNLDPLCVAIVMSRQTRRRGLKQEFRVVL